jgi:NADH-quinone oxidoreductase subunit L
VTGGHGEQAPDTEEHAEDHTTLEWALMLTSVGIAVAGIGLAWKMYGGDVRSEPLRTRLGGLYGALWNKYWVDEAYDAMFVNRSKDLGTGLWAFDDAIVDGVVNGTANATLQSANASNEFDERVVDGAVDGVGYGLWSGSWLFRGLQTGFVQNYALIIAVGMFVLVSAWLLF